MELTLSTPDRDVLKVIFTNHTTQGTITRIFFQKSTPVSFAKTQSNIFHVSFYGKAPQGFNLYVSRDSCHY